MDSVTLRRPLLTLTLIALLGSVVEHGWAGEPEADPDPRRELAPFGEAPAAGSSVDVGSSSLSLGLAVARKQSEGYQVAGSLLVSLPTARWWSGQPKAKSARSGKRSPAPTAAVDPAESDAKAAASSGEFEPCSEPPTGATPRPESPDNGDLPPRAQPVIRPSDARAAVRAALRSAGLSSRLARLDDLSSRARWSAALPRVRLRVTRLIDESSSLAPTSYDADRLTARGGTSLWLEARTTWHLDRALFADEEVSLERLRYQTSRDRQRSTRAVLEVLFAWHRAAAELAHWDSRRAAAECHAAVVQEQQLAIEIDLLTAGWFSQWAARNSARRPQLDCGREADGGLE